MSSPRVALITLAHGRHEHLRGQLWGLRRQTSWPDMHVVVAMADPLVRQVVAGSPIPTLLSAVDTDDAGLPLAAARNRGAEAALGAGADLLIFLDVDCIPAPTLLQRYVDVMQHPEARTTPVFACGEVAYLPAVEDPSQYRVDELVDWAEPHPGRPRPGAGEVLVGKDPALFWSLSFATSTPTWELLGGFDEAYIGYGGEDTDLGQRLHAAGGHLLWVGGAAAYHQYHPVEDPPVRHVASIVRNANLFHDRWGWFPMTTWLEGFARVGLAHFDEHSGRWALVRRAGAGTQDRG